MLTNWYGVSALKVAILSKLSTNTRNKLVTTNAFLLQCLKWFWFRPRGIRTSRVRTQIICRHWYTAIQLCEPYSVVCSKQYVHKSVQFQLNNGTTFLLPVGRGSINALYGYFSSLEGRLSTMPYPKFIWPQYLFMTFTAHFSSMASLK